MKTIHVGRLLRASTRACVAGCPPAQEFPAFGSLLRIPLDETANVYALVSGIHIDDDGLVRQLVTNPDVSEAIIQDNRLNRNVPVEMDLLFIGLRQGERISHLLPPRPPLSLDNVYPCDPAEICAFTVNGYGYLRHILAAEEVPVADLLAAHLLQAGQAHRDGGKADWIDQAIMEIIASLRDDYARLIPAMQAIAEVKSSLSTDSSSAKGVK